MTDLKMGGVNRSPLRLVDKLWPPGIGKDRFTVAAMKRSTRGIELSSNDRNILPYFCSKHKPQFDRREVISR